MCINDHRTATGRAIPYRRRRRRYARVAAAQKSSDWPEWRSIERRCPVWYRLPIRYCGIGLCEAKASLRQEISKHSELSAKCVHAHSETAHKANRLSIALRLRRVSPETSMLSRVILKRSLKNSLPESFHTSSGAVRQHVPVSEFAEEMLNENLTQRFSGPGISAKYRV